MACETLHGTDRGRRHGPQPAWRGLICPWADRRAVAALEFALIAPVYVLTIMALFQISMDFLAQGILDYAAKSAARIVQIGDPSLDGATSPEKFVATIVKPYLMNFVSPANVVVDLESAADFATPFPAIPDPVAQTSFNFCYGPPGGQLVSGQMSGRMILHLVYAAPTMLPSWFPGLVTYGGSKAFPIISTAAFYNEPYSGSGSGFTPRCSS